MKIFAPPCKRTPMGRLLVHKGLGQYSQTMFKQGIHDVEPLTREDMTEIGIKDPVHLEYLHGLLGGVAMRKEAQRSEKRLAASNPFSRLAALLFGDVAHLSSPTRCNDCQALVDGRQQLTPRGVRTVDAFVIRRLLRSIAKNMIHIMLLNSSPS